MTQNTTLAEDFGLCVGCNEPIQIGQVLTVWDDETGHADCDRPFDLGHQHPADADWPKPVVLLGDPAKHIPLSALRHSAGDACPNPRCDSFSCAKHDDVAGDAGAVERADCLARICCDAIWGGEHAFEEATPAQFAILREKVRAALASRPTEAPEAPEADRLARLEGALVWYEEQVRNCRKVTSEGDAARQQLDRDGGERARNALKEPTDATD